MTSASSEAICYFPGLHLFDQAVTAEQIHIALLRFKSDYIDE